MSKVRALPDVLREILEIFIRIHNPRPHLLNEIMYYLDVLNKPSKIEVDVLYDGNGLTKIYSPEDVNELLEKAKKS